MRKGFYNKIVFLSLFLFEASSALLAQFEEGKQTIYLATPLLKGSAIIANATNTLTYSNAGEDSAKIKNIITFKINEDDTTYFASGFSATVNFTLDCKATLSSSAVQTSKSLTINYDKTAGAKYNVRAYIVLPREEEVKITVTSISITGQSGWDPLTVLQLDNEMRVLRYYTLSNNSTTLSPSFNSAVNDTDAVAVSWVWNSATNNNLSQLEWAWVENEMEDFYKDADTLNFSRLFQNNSTRVDLDYGQNGYTIPLLYDGVGKLYYRIRAAYRKNDGSVITGPWSAVQNFSFNGHEPNLNWQSATSFAENGKFKSVIQYFDGSLRSRQTVTKDNTTGNTIVAETIYDLQGRANIQILPTPTSDNIIKYFINFNRFKGQADNEDPSKYFDLTPAALQCNKPPALDSNYGNAKYYSNQNPWLSTENISKYIPDAQGYAYTETRFTDDATQRVMVQGGVGINHQISSGHETKYFYGKPSQPELDALFGTEVGDASHYSKNMVQDANGQMSVSYVDMHGRTIATALAGDAPANLSSIKSDTASYPQTSGTLKNSLLTSATNIVKGNSIESISTILVPATTVYNFTYKLDPAILSQMNCNSQQICFDCKYDLEISIKQEGCSNATPKIRRYNNLQIVSSNQCSNSMGFTGDGVSTATKQIDFSDTLTAGSYVIRKTLSINDSMFSVRRDSTLKDFLCKSQQSIYDSIYNLLYTTSGCGVPADSSYNCDSCQAHLGTFSQYKVRYLLAIGADTASSQYDATIHNQYSLDSSECSANCGGLNSNQGTLLSLRKQMLADMTPFSGQYALDSVKNSSGSIDLTRLEAKYNIFTNQYIIGGTTYTKSYYYRNPKNESGSSSWYYTDDGLVDSTIHQHDASGNPILDTISKTNFTNLFQPSWASSLIYYHPEFSKLKIAETTLKTSYEWMDKMQSCTSYSQAHSLNYDDPLTSDTFFVRYATTAEKDTMSKRLINGVTYHSGVPTGPSIWQIANGSVLCATTDSAGKYACYMSQDSTGVQSSLSSSDKDKVWNSFKSLYAYYRNEVLLRYINNQSGVLSHTDMVKLQSEGKQLVFANAASIANQNGWTSWWTVVSNGDTTGLSSTEGHYADSSQIDKCEGQRPFLRSRLLQCEQLMTLLENNNSTDSTTVNTIINTILDSMVMVCHHSLDIQHPFGATTANPTYTGNPKTFEEIVNHVFSQHSIATLPGDHYFCNPFSVDFPKPYGKNPPLMSSYSNVIDSCGCKRFDSLRIEAHNNSVDTSSFTAMNQFLLSNYHDTLTLALWNGLKNCKNIFQDTCNHFSYHIQTDTSGCPRGRVDSVIFENGGATLYYTNQNDYGYCVALAFNQNNDLVAQVPIECNGSATFIDSLNPCTPYRFLIMSTFEACSEIKSDTLFYNGCSCPKKYTPIILSQFVAMPPALGCDYKKPCISCAKLDSLTAEFRTIYSSYSSVPYLDSTATDEQAKQNSLWARFLNYRTGMSKNAIDYLNAYKNCPSHPSTSATVAICGFDKPLNDITDIYPQDTIPCQRVQTQALFISQLLYQKMKDSLIANFDSLYKAKCLSAQNSEEFYALYQPKEYHYTLYYYDQAGNLVKTMPPAAVKPNYNSTYLASVVTARNANTDVSNSNNNEVLATQYRYNSLNQVAAQKSPDGGKTKFWYDRLGRLVISQNAQQQTQTKYSYTLYDVLGRIMEVGEKPQGTAMTQATSQDTTALQSWMSATGTKIQITHTVYDEAYTPLAVNKGLYQKNLRNRVSYTYIKNVDDNGYTWDAATFYSYDIHGNVDTLLQDFNTGMGAISCSNSDNPSGNRFKKMVYDFDLISGKVNAVAYQPGEKDQFYHRYSYDAENKLTDVETSKDKIYWEKDARYGYYRHGPLARTVLGQNQMQGVDYAYTIQGWLKGVNSTGPLTSSIAGGGNDCGSNTAVNNLYVYQRLAPYPNQYIARRSINFGEGFESLTSDEFETNLNPSLDSCSHADSTAGLETGVGNNAVFDMGQDGWTDSVGRFIPTTTNIKTTDAYGFSLNYFNGDYKPINTTVTPFAAIPLSLPADPVSGIATGAELFNGNIAAMAVSIPKLGNGKIYGYRYDQLNRIVRMDAFDGLNGDRNIFTAVRINDYHEEVTYDPNGNIKTYLRNGTTQNNNLLSMDSLTYKYYAGSNQLRQVRDSVNANNYTEDIDNQSDTSNYVYDAIGNLIKDKSENIDSIKWTVYGKIQSIYKHSGQVIKYIYDATGSRISKIDSSSGGVKKTFYVRDATGNAMSIYQSGIDSVNSGHLTQTEIHLYGSSRLGIYNVSLDVQNCVDTIAEIVIFKRGNKFFELTNHLGNILVTVSDKKIAIDANSNGVTDYYNADVVSATDYYPFGMLMPARQYYAANSYRYGFNGKENDNEVKGEGNQQDYGMRIYDPRLGRFLSVDPLINNYPELTPYQFASNIPIRAIDLDGLEMLPPEVFKDDKHPLQSVKDAADITFKFLKGAGKGFVNWAEKINPWDVSDEAWERRTNSFQGLVNTVTHPQQIPINIKNSLKDWTKRLMSSDPEVVGEAFMNGITTGVDIYSFYQSVRSLTRFVTSSGSIVKELNSASIRVSQETVNGPKLKAIMEDMKTNGWKNQDPIDIVKMEDDIYTSVDHKRLVAAEKLGIDVKANAHNFDDIMPEEMAIRFKDANGNLPKTWGEAVKNRISNQPANFQQNNPNGTFVRPRVTNNTNE